MPTTPEEKLLRAIFGEETPEKKSDSELSSHEQLDREFARLIDELRDIIGTEETNNQTVYERHRLEVAAQISKQKLDEIFKRATTEKSASEEIIGKYKLKNGNIEEADTLKRSGHELDEKFTKAKKFTELSIPPEEKYVRRTKKEFEAGAKPVKAGEESHRLTRISLTVTPDLKDAITDVRQSHNITQMEWLRAAVRYALENHQNFDPRKVLDSELKILIEESGDDPSPP